MAVLALTRWTVRALGCLPGSLHRALDRWSYRIALRRRDRRRLVRQTLQEHKS